MWMCTGIPYYGMSTGCIQDVDTWLHTGWHRHLPHREQSFQVGETLQVSLAPEHPWYETWFNLFSPLCLAIIWEGHLETWRFPLHPRDIPWAWIELSNQFYGTSLESKSPGAASSLLMGSSTSLQSSPFQLEISKLSSIKFRTVFDLKDQRTKETDHWLQIERAGGKRRSSFLWSW